MRLVWIKLAIEKAKTHKVLRILTFLYVTTLTVGNFKELFDVPVYYIMNDGHKFKN